MPENGVLDPVPAAYYHENSNTLDGLVLFSMTLSGDIGVLPELEVIHLSPLLLTGDHKLYTFRNID